MPYMTYSGWHVVQDWDRARLHSQRVVDWLVRPSGYNHLELAYELMRQRAGGGNGTFDRKDVLAKLHTELQAVLPRATYAADCEGPSAGDTHLSASQWWDSPCGKRVNIAVGIASLCEGREDEPAYAQLRRLVLEEGWDRSWEVRCTLLEYLHITEHTNDDRVKGTSHRLAKEILERACGPRFTSTSYDDDQAIDDAVWNPGEPLLPQSLVSSGGKPFQPHLWWRANTVLASAADSEESCNHSRRLILNTLRVLVDWLRGGRKAPMTLDEDFAVRHVLFNLRQVSVPGCGRFLIELLSWGNRYVELPAGDKCWQFKVNVWEEALQIASRACKAEVFAGRGAIFSDNERAGISEVVSDCLKVSAHPRAADTSVVIFEILGFLGDERMVPLMQVTHMNPLVAKQAVISLCQLLGVKECTRLIVQRVAKNQSGDLPDPLHTSQHVEALKFMPSRAAMEAALEGMMDVPEAAEAGAARMLLSRVGGISALKKLESRATSAEAYMSMVQATERTAQERFESALRDARSGFFVSLVMDLSVFLVGLTLIIVSAALVVQREGNLESWAGVGATSGTGALGVLYTLLVGKPRERVRKGVNDLMKLKMAFLGFLRQLQQCDHAFTRKMLDDEGMSPADLAEYTNLVRTVTSTAIEMSEVHIPSTSNGLATTAKIAPDDML